MVVGIAIAILICEVKNTKMKKIYQSAILLPFLMSMVILSYIVYALLSAENGLVNNTILPLLHIDPIQWYQKPKYWPAILIIANCWKGVGYGCLIYIASLIGIDPTYYEAKEDWMEPQSGRKSQKSHCHAWYRQSLRCYY